MPWVSSCATVAGGGFSLTSKGELFHQETLRLLAELDGFEQYAAASRANCAAPSTWE